MGDGGPGREYVGPKVQSHRKNIGTEKRLKTNSDTIFLAPSFYLENIQFVPITIREK